MTENPFTELGLDPCMSVEELTRVLRERVERLPSKERSRIQSLWRELTLRDDQRLRLAFFAHPKPLPAQAGSDELPAGHLRSAIPAVPERLQPQISLPRLEPKWADVLRYPKATESPKDVVLRAVQFMRELTDEDTELE